MEKQEEIKLIAYHLWEEEGHSYGKDLEYYYRAEAIYQQQHSLANPTGKSVQVAQPGAATANPALQDSNIEEAEAHEGHHGRARHPRHRGARHQSDRGNASI